MSWQVQFRFATPIFFSKIWLLYKNRLMCIIVCLLFVSLLLEATYEIVSLLAIHKALYNNIIYYCLLLYRPKNLFQANFPVKLVAAVSCFEVKSPIIQWMMKWWFYKILYSFWSFWGIAVFIFEQQQKIIFARVSMTLISFEICL